MEEFEKELIRFHYRGTNVEFLDGIEKNSFFDWKDKLDKRVVHEDFGFKINTVAIKMIRTKSNLLNKDETIHGYRKRKIVDILTLEELYNERKEYLLKHDEEKVWDFEEEILGHFDYEEEDLAYVTYTIKGIYTEIRIKNKKTGKIRKANNFFFDEKSPYSKLMQKKIVETLLSIKSQKNKTMKKMLMVGFNLELSTPELYKMRDRYLKNNGLIMQNYFGRKSFNENYFEIVKSLKGSL